jgi:O-antigen/teichoic acid export membrane protein
MQENPFAPPNSLIQDVSSRSAVANENTPWFLVSVTKLFIMSLCTLTLYQVYWLYQHWRRVKRREGLDINPAARSIFGVFFCYQLFAKIRDFERPDHSPSSLAAGALAAGWIVATLLWRLPDPYWWVAMSSMLFTLPVQAQANANNAAVDPNHVINSRLTALNWVAVVVGGLLLFLAVVGTLMPQ